MLSLLTQSCYKVLMFKLYFETTNCTTELQNELQNYVLLLAMCFVEKTAKGANK